MSQHSTMRASDADRDRVVERLRHATAEGRLLAYELEERLARALRARTYGELDAVVADLPGQPVARRRGGEVSEWIRPVVAAVVLVPLAFVLASIVFAAALFVMTGVFSMWMLWLVVGWLLFVPPRHVGTRGRHRGGSPFGDRSSGPPFGRGAQRRSTRRTGHWH
jgi:hypothetical protein